MLKDGEISLEQLYKMLHISKRKAAWMLQNGIIPCEIRPTKTHRYVILKEDVDAYLRKKARERRKEIPVGIFNAKPTKRMVVLNRQPVDTVTIAECYITIAEDYREDFRNHVEKRLKYFPDAVTADKAAEIIGYTKSTMISHIREKHISAVLISGKYIVPKSALVDFIVSDAAFEIVNKSPWHMNTILQFAEDE